MARRVAQATMMDTPRHERTKAATEFATPEAREKYLKSHPNADPAKHTVKKDVRHVPKRPSDEIQKEVKAMSPSQVKGEVKKLSPEFKARFEEVHGQLSHIKDEDQRNQSALLQVKGEENYERVETERKPKKKSSQDRVAYGHSVRWMQEAAGNLNKASGRISDAESYMGGSLDLLVEALDLIKIANANVSDADTENLVREVTALIRLVDSNSRSVVSKLRVLRGKVNEAREQYEDEIAWEIQHPSD